MSDVEARKTEVTARYIELVDFLSYATSPNTVDSDRAHRFVLLHEDRRSVDAGWKVLTQFSLCDRVEDLNTLSEEHRKQRVERCASKFAKQANTVAETNSRVQTFRVCAFNRPVIETEAEPVDTHQFNLTGRHRETVGLEDPTPEGERSQIQRSFDRSMGTIDRLIGAMEHNSSVQASEMLALRGEIRQMLTETRAMAAAVQDALDREAERKVKADRGAIYNDAIRDGLTMIRDVGIPMLTDYIAHAGPMGKMAQQFFTDPKFAMMLRGMWPSMNVEQRKALEPAVRVYLPDLLVTKTEESCANGAG